MFDARCSWSAQRNHLLQDGVRAAPSAAPGGASRRTRAGCGRSSRRGRPRGRSSAPPGAAASGRRPVARSSSRWPSTPCSGLFSSWAMPATNWPSAASFSDCVSRLRSSSRSASSLRLRRQVARDEHGADPLALLVEQVGDRDHERPVQDRIDDLAGRPPPRPSAARGSASWRGQPRGQLRADVVGQRPVEQLVARLPDARRRTPRWRGRSGRADRTTTTRCAIESKVFSSSRRDRITSSSSCMVSIGARELPPELVGAVEQIELAAGLDAHAFEDDRAEGAPAAAQRNRHSRWTSSSAERDDLGACAAHRRRRGRRRVVGADAHAARDAGRVGRRLQHEMAGAAIVDPDRRAIGAEQAVGAVAEDLEPGRRGSASPRGCWRIRRAAHGGRAAARRVGAGGTSRAR